MRSDRDLDLRGGRIVDLGEPEEPNDALRLADLDEFAAKMGIAKLAGAKLPGGGRRAPARVQSMITLFSTLDESAF